MVSQEKAGAGSVKVAWWLIEADIAIGAGK